MKRAGAAYRDRPQAGPAPSFRTFLVSLLRALGANGALLATAIATGWIVSADRGVDLPINPPDASGDDIYWSIVANNARVVSSLVAGALTLCVYTAIVLLWNGYSLGSGLASLRRVQPDLLRLTAPHVALEFTALLLGASAAWILLGDCIGCLANERTVRVRGVAAVLTASLVLLLVAAWFEVRLIDGDFSPWAILFR